MWKILREILALLWKLLRTLLENRLKQILKRALVFAFIAIAAIAVVVFFLTQILL